MMLRKRLLAAAAAYVLALAPALAQVDLPPVMYGGPFGSGNGSGGGGGGGGGVTNVSTGACLTGGPITTTGTVSGTYLIDAQTGTSYTIPSSDACQLVTFSNASPVAVTLPQATGSFGVGWSFDVQNLGAGTVTITPTTSTINGAATLTIAQNKGCTIVSDGTNYQVTACNALGGGTGTVTSVAETVPGGFSISGSPVTTSGTLAIGANGTSGGVVCYTGATTSASSSALTANLPVIGGGAGACPTVGTRSGNTTAFATTSGSFTTNDCIKADANGNLVDVGGPCGTSTGTVSSVTITVPSRETATGCVITTSGTCAITDNTQTKNTIFSGPASGANAAPTFRALASADMPAMPPNAYAANRWYWMVSNRVSNSGYTANTIRWAPVYITRAITISNLGMSAFSGAASQNVQLAIYASDATLAPTGSALCSTASITVATNVKFSAACAATLTPGLYWFGANVDAASLSMVSQDSTSTTGGSIAGSAAEANLGADASLNTLVQYNTSQTFGTWPSSPTITESASNAANGPMMYFKVSSVP